MHMHLCSDVNDVNTNKKVNTHSITSSNIIKKANTQKDGKIRINWTVLHSWKNTIFLIRIEKDMIGWVINFSSKILMAMLLLLFFFVSVGSLNFGDKKCEEFWLVKKKFENFD